MTDNAVSNPSIVAPVSRLLATADLGRSVAFYRDVLGFRIEPRPAAGPGQAGAEVARLTRGPTTIRLSTGIEAIDSTMELRPRGSAMIFFETNNLEGMRDAIVTKGGNPTEIEKVNWIKMRMFQVQDPDGHTLWFGKSFQEPDWPLPDPMLIQALPNFPFNDVKAAIAHYRDVLGFRINYARDDFGVMYRDKATILLVPRGEKFRGIGSCYVYVRDADGLHAELTASGARVEDTPESHPWGLRDFLVIDLEGNEITFGQPFE